MITQDYGSLRSLVNTLPLISYDVDLDAGACSCQRWKVIRILYAHALTNLREKAIPTEQYGDNYFRIENFKAKYGEFFILLPI